MEKEPAGKRTRILVVEDDVEVRRELEGYLKEHAFAVTGAADGPQMRRAVAHDDFDLVIMDLNLPGEDGLALTQELRRTSGVPVIMVTGRTDTMDRVLGLELGADDYITKPYELRELLARIKTVLRRSGSGPPDQPEAAGRTVVFADWRLDLHSRELFGPSGEAAELTTAEFNLLQAFVDSPKRTLDRDYLLDRVHGRDWSPYDRSIDNLVHRLRQKIEADAKHPKIIKSVRGVGYMLAVDVKKA